MAEKRPSSLGRYRNILQKVGETVKKVQCIEGLIIDHSIHTICGTDFYVFFVGGWDDYWYAELRTPFGELIVFPSKGAVWFKHYIGGEWERDRESFLHSIHVNSRLYEKPRIYLSYVGSWDTPDYPQFEHRKDMPFLDYHTEAHRLTRATTEYGDYQAVPDQEDRTDYIKPYLIHDNDLGREYDLQRDEPAYFLTHEVLNAFSQWLQNNVLCLLPMSSPKVS